MTFETILYLSLALLILKIFNDIADGYSRNLRKIRDVLNSLHKSYFRDVPQEDAFQHRVTLFKARRCAYLPLGRPKYLCIFARSGTAFQKSTSYFDIDDEREERNQGIAGRSWFTNAAAAVVLPPWPDDLVVDAAKDPRCIEYAEMSFMPVKKAALLRVKSRSVTASVVRHSSGRKWGVLVLDSRDPAAIAKTPENKIMVTLSADLLTHMIS